MSDIDLAEAIRLHPLFDAAWYAARYGDVAILGADPAQQFLTYGRLLGRSPGPGFDSAFYLAQYADIGEQNPLLHYAALPKDRPRPVTPAQLRDLLDGLERETRQRWQPEAPPTPRARPPVISYCIPVMQRLEDIQQTLPDNLAAHADLAEEVEFVVILFDADNAAEQWITQRFGPELETGLLRVIRDHSLDSWHFGKAKNAFRPHILGEVYSSLDGDNFVTPDETRLLLKTHAEYGGHFLLHHFSGSWGDGSSGRISLPAVLYRAIGYDPLLLPRQYDEMDLILRSLHRFPTLPFLCADPASNALTLSSHARRFCEEEALPNRIIAFAPHTRRAPLNPRGTDYVARSPHLNHMGNLNAATSGLILSTDAKRRDAYRHRLQIEKHLLLETLPRDVALDTFFQARGRPSWVPPVDVAAFVVVKNEASFLPALVRHYRALGVGAFFIIDDGSTEPVETLLDAPDIHVFHPKVGRFRTDKTAWIEALMKVFVPEGNWVLTVDADEFIQMPEGFTSFPGLARHVEAAGADFAPAVMLDLVPAPGTPAAQLEHAERDFAALFTHCCDIDSPVPETYAKIASIAWGFGPHAGLSWRLDTRYHAFGTVDSLRKIPFLRYRRDRHLNQGFHTLHHADGRGQPGHDIWTRRPLLPVYHYKMVKLFSEQARAQMLREAGNYHERTGGNLATIFGGTGGEAFARLQTLSASLVPAGTVVRQVLSATG